MAHNLSLCSIDVSVKVEATCDVCGEELTVKCVDTTLYNSDIETQVSVLPCTECCVSNDSKKLKEEIERLKKEIRLLNFGR